MPSRIVSNVGYEGEDLRGGPGDGRGPGCAEHVPTSSTRWLSDAAAGEAAFMNRHVCGGDRGVVPLGQLGRESVRDRAEVLFADRGVEVVECSVEVLRIGLDVDLHRRRLRMDLHDGELFSGLVKIKVEGDH